MVAQFVAALERPVSRVRLENYRTAGGSDLEMVTNYFYNLELSEALYPTLQAFEVALRNSIHLVLTNDARTPFWFDRSGFLPPWQTQEVSTARKKLMRDGKPLVADRIVAELKFGFWHSLFNSPFERNLWRPDRSARVLDVFPQIPAKQRSRQTVWNRCDRIRIIRNRVMHYEPIWARPNLDRDHFEILEAIQWISEAMHETIAMCDRFPTVYASGRSNVSLRIQAEIKRRYS